MLNYNFFKIGAYLLLLSMLDAFFTDLGIRKSLITEANPLMNGIYERSIVSFYALKIIMPLLLVGILSKIQPSLFIKILIIVAASLYSAILLMHIMWINMAIL